MQAINKQSINKQSTIGIFMGKANSSWHSRIMWITVAIVFGHLAEHLSQIYQIYALGWLPKEAGGILGLWYPSLAQSEVLHIAYNSSIWIGLWLLRPGIKATSKIARIWWDAALILQSWHFFEHGLLQYQYVTGINFFGASVRTGIGQLWFPRPELHFFYNMMVFVPFIIAYFYYTFRDHKQETAVPQGV